MSSLGVDNSVDALVDLVRWKHQRDSAETIERRRAVLRAWQGRVPVEAIARATRVSEEQVEADLQAAGVDIHAEQRVPAPTVPGDWG